MVRRDDRSFVFFPDRAFVWRRFVATFVRSFVRSIVRVRVGAFGEVYQERIYDLLDASVDRSRPLDEWREVRLLEAGI